MRVSNKSNENLFNINKHGYKWNAKRIKEHLDDLLVMKAHIFNHFFRFDHEDKYFYIYDNDCYLFVFDKKIEVRSDRENVFSANKTFTYKITESKAIQTAYEHFCSVTMESDEDD